MAKKKKVVTQVEQPKRVFSEEEVQAALEMTHSEYFMQVMALLSHRPENKELNYVRVPVVTPQGGTYLVSILHVDGPKIDLTKLAAAAEEVERENKNADPKAGVSENQTNNS